MLEKSQEVAEIVPSHDASASKRWLPYPRSVGPRFLRIGGAAVIPPGGFNPPPTEGGAGRAGPQAHRFQIRSDPSQIANLKGQAHYAGLGS